MIARWFSAAVLAGAAVVVALRLPSPAAAPIDLCLVIALACDVGDKLRRR